MTINAMSTDTAAWTGLEAPRLSGPTEHIEALRHVIDVVAR